MVRARGTVHCPYRGRRCCYLAVFASISGEAGAAGPCRRRCVLARSGDYWNSARRLVTGAASIQVRPRAMHLMASPHAGIGNVRAHRDRRACPTGNFVQEEETDPRPRPSQKQADKNDPPGRIGNAFQPRLRASRRHNAKSARNSCSSVPAARDVTSPWSY